MAAWNPRANEIFLAAVEIVSPAEQRAYVDAACAQDQQLRRAVEALLQAHAQAGSFLDRPGAATLAPPDEEFVAVTSALEKPGTVIAGRYKLLQQIGEGGMGVVYMAEQQEPVRRKVALKIIKPGMDSAQVIARFEAERQALAMMDHQNIARVLDAGATASGRPYFVMELVHGVPITTFCDDNHLTPRDRLELFIPVCHAIQHAHQKGIIHRDIKPSNVLVTMYDDKPVPKVIDFGVAKAVEQRLTEKTLFTQFGALVGTFEYMSPEQAEMNAFGVDTRSDIYSLGVLLYELLTGTTPLEKTRVRAAGLNEVVRLIKEEEPLRPSMRLSTSGTLAKIAAARKTEPAQLAKLVRGELDWIVMKSLEKDRSRRYETANGMAQDVQRYLTDEPVQAGPPSATYRLRKFVKRNRGTVTVAAVVLTTLLAGILGTSWGWVEALDQGKTAVKAVSDARDAEAGKASTEETARIAAEIARATLEKQQAKTKDALALAIENARLAEKRREEADVRREQAEGLALRVQFEHYFSKAEDRPELALVGMASLLPKAARLKDPSLENSLRLHVGELSGRTTQLRAICAHEFEVNYVALSADGTTALTRDMRASVRLWETATGKQIGLPLPHDGVRAIALSADGKTALTGNQAPFGQRSTARLWETATGKLIGSPLQHQHWVVAVALSADGKTALTGSWDSTAQIWETATGKPIGPPLQHHAYVFAVALSADGKTALTGSHDKTARLWETATGKPIGLPLQHQASVNGAALSADGKIALTRTDDAAWLWETATGKPIGPPLQHQGLVHAMALSADGTMALTGSKDKTARLWQTATGKPIGPPLQHTKDVVSVALSADGKTALTGSWDGRARLWETATGKPLGTLRHNAVYGVALSADGKMALTGGPDKTARLWQTVPGQLTGVLLQHQKEVHVVALSADGKTALTGSADKTARLWETSTGKPIGPPLQHQHEVHAVALSADGKTALTGSWDKTARLWETATGKPIGPPLQHQHEVHAVALSADGKTAMTGSEDRTARLWDAATGKAIGPPLQHHAWVRAVVLSADGKTALTASDDHTTQLWNAATGKPIGRPMRHQGHLYAVALSADGKTALAARLWHAASGEPIGPPDEQRAARAVALSADGTTALTTGNDDGTAQLWNAATGKRIGPPLLHQDKVVAVALSADGKTALTGSEDRTAQLWETATGKPIGPPLQHHDKLVAVALSADGKTALTGSADKTARLWKVPQPIRGDPERIILWTQVITVLEVDELTAVHILDAETLQLRRQRLQHLGGPPPQ